MTILCILFVVMMGFQSLHCMQAQPETDGSKKVSLIDMLREKYKPTDGELVDMLHVMLHLKIESNQSEATTQQAKSDDTAKDELKNESKKVSLHDVLGTKDRDLMRKVVTISDESSVNAVNDEGCPVLHAAIQSGCDMDIIILLLRQKALPNVKMKNGNTALHLAVLVEDCEFRAEMIRALILAGADETAKNDEDKTPVQLAEDNSDKLAADFEESAKWNRLAVEVIPNAVRERAARWLLEA